MEKGEKVGHVGNWSVVIGGKGSKVQSSIM